MQVPNLYDLLSEKEKADIQNRNTKSQKECDDWHIQRQATEKKQAHDKRIAQFEQDKKKGLLI